MWKQILGKLFAEPNDAEADKRAAYKQWQRQQNGERALILARVISRDDSAVTAPVQLSIGDPRAYLQQYGELDRRFESADDVSPFWAAWNALLQANYLGFIDWRSDADELRDAMNPLRARRGIDSFDWSFIDDLIAAGDSESLKNENLLPIVRANVAKHGFVLVSINTGGDSYDFALVTPDEFAMVDGLNGVDFEVGTFA